MTYTELFLKANGHTGNDLRDQLIADFLTVQNTNKIICPDVFYATVGFEFNIYYDALVIGFDAGLNSPLGVYVDIQCPTLQAASGIAVRMDRQWQILASDLTSDYIGTHLFYIKVYNHVGSLLDSKTCTLVISAATALSVAKNCLIIGDSLTKNGLITSKINTLFTGLSGTNPTFWGTKTNGGMKDEGISGWSFGSFLSTTSPFYSGIAIDFAWYRDQLGLTSNFDFVGITLGINDSLGDVKDMGAVLANQVALINYILADNPNCKILLNITPSDANTVSSWHVYSDQLAYSRKFAYQSNIKTLRQLMYDEFIQTKWNGKVYLGQAAFGLDRYYGYEFESRNVAFRLTGVTENYHVNCVHPVTAGYNQLSDMYFYQMLNILNL